LSNNQLICDVVGLNGFTLRHSVDDGIERHATVFIFKGILYAMQYLVPGLDDRFGREGGMMQHAWRWELDWKLGVAR
jgi:hypothetical protein